MNLKYTYEVFPIYPGQARVAFERKEESLEHIKHYPDWRASAAHSSKAEIKADSEDDWMRRYFGLFYEQRTPYFVDENGIAHIHVLGALSYKLTGLEKYCEQTSYKDIKEEWKQATEDKNVVGIWSEFTTPGGGIVGCPELGDFILASRKVKPSLAWVPRGCYSAGQWLAANCSATYMAKSAGLGSIGVILAKMDYEKFLDEVGLHYEFITPSECDLKSTYCEEKPLSEAQKEYVQAQVEYSNNQFRAAIKDARGEVDKKWMRGQGLNAEEAIKAGLADAISTEEEAYRDLLSLTK